MRPRHRWILAGFVTPLILAVTHNAAAVSVAPGTPGLSGEGEFGYSQTSGNTDTSSLNTKLGFGFEQEDWRNALQLEAVNKTDSDATIAERYYGAAKSEYTLTLREYVFGSLDYEKDRFSGYAHRTNFGAGYGRRILVSTPLTLNAEVGTGYRWSQLEPGGEQDEVTLRLSAGLGWVISESAGFTQELVTVVGEEDTATRAFSALTSKIIGQFSLRLSYLLSHHSTAPPGKNKTDTETAVTLVFGF